MKTHCDTHGAVAFDKTRGGVECVLCRRERQRGWHYNLQRRITRRSTANQRDLATMKELIAKWQG